MFKELKNTTSDKKGNFVKFKVSSSDTLYFKRNGSM